MGYKTNWVCEFIFTHRRNYKFFGLLVVFFKIVMAPSKDPKQLEKKEKRRQCLKELKKRTYCILVCVK